MTKITILTSYFGTFNSFFPLWMQSVSYNPTISFKLLTDNDVEAVPENVEVIHMSFAEMQNRIRALFDFPIVCETGYKMSEYQVLFALVFPELVKDANFWGYCEMDLILGNLRNFFTEDKLKKYDKIYWLGHVTLYRNTPEINALGLKNHKYPTATYRQAFSTPYNYHFIEGGGMYLIAKMSGLRCYEGIEFADIAVEYYNFVLAWKENGHLPGIIKWQNGILTWVYLENNKIQEEEISYVHLQKRKMTVEVSSPQNGFLIVPNRFIDIQEITPEFILANAQDTVEWHREYKKKLAKYYLETIKQGGIKIKIDKIIRKLRYQ